MWTPVVVRKDGQMRISGSGEWDMNVGLKFGWIASRAPPIRGIRDGFLAGDDISAMVLEKLHLQSDERVPLEVLYDCRFLLRLRPERLPEWVMEVLSHSHNAWHIRIIPRGKYYLPTVVLRVEGHEDILLGGDGITSGISKDVKESEWLEIVFVRTLDAL
jgi:tRNA(Ile)-lysidine synthase